MIPSWLMHDKMPLRFSSGFCKKRRKPPSSEPVLAKNALKRLRGHRWNSREFLPPGHLTPAIMCGINNSEKNTDSIKVYLCCRRRFFCNIKWVVYGEGDGGHNCVYYIIILRSWKFSLALYGAPEKLLQNYIKHAQ